MAEEKVVEEKAAVPEAAPEKKMSTLAKVGIGIGVIIVAGGCYYAYSRLSADDPAKPASAEL